MGLRYRPPLYPVTFLGTYWNGCCCYCRRCLDERYSILAGGKSATDSIAGGPKDGCVRAFPLVPDPAYIHVPAAARLLNGFSETRYPGQPGARKNKGADDPGQSVNGIMEQLLQRRFDKAGKGKSWIKTAASRRANSVQRPGGNLNRNGRCGT